MVGEDGAGSEVEVGGGVEFGGHDVDVVASHACGEGSETATVVASGKGMQFAVVRLVFDGFENAFEHVDALGVAYQEHVVGEVVAGQMNVVKAPVRSQYQFAFFNSHRSCCPLRRLWSG